MIMDKVCIHSMKVLVADNNEHSLDFVIMDKVCIHSMKDLESTGSGQQLKMTYIILKRRKIRLLHHATCMILFLG